MSSQLEDATSSSSTDEPDEHEELEAMQQHDSSSESGSQASEASGDEGSAEVSGDEGSDWGTDAAAEDEEAEESGITELHNAAELGLLHLVQQLLDDGQVAVSAASRPSRITPLHLAARNGHGDVVQLLLERQANVGAKTADEEATPLLEAACWGHLQVVRLLMEQGRADAGAAASNGNTALHLAALNGHSQMVQYLIGRGEDAWVFNNKGRSPLELAAQAGHKKVVKQLLATAAAELHPALHREVHAGQAGGGVQDGQHDVMNMKFEAVCQAAHLAVRHKRRSVLPLLLQVLGAECVRQQELFEAARERDWEDSFYRAVLDAWRLAEKDRPLDKAWTALRDAQRRERQEVAAQRSGVQQLLVQAAGVVRQALQVQQQQQGDGDGEAVGPAAAAGAEVAGEGDVQPVEVRKRKAKSGSSEKGSKKKKSSKKKGSKQKSSKVKRHK